MPPSKREDGLRQSIAHAQINATAIAEPLGAVAEGKVECGRDFQGQRRGYLGDRLSVGDDYAGTFLRDRSARQQGTQCQRKEKHPQKIGFAQPPHNTFSLARNRNTQDARCQSGPGING